MGTKVQLKSCLPGYFSMRDLNEDSNSCSWPHYYEDKTLTNGQHYNGFFSRNVDAYLGHDKDTLKRIMFKHEDIFKNQVSELHRLYRIQRELMDEFKKKDLQNNRIPIEPSLSSSLLASQITTEEANKWHIPSFPVANSLNGLPSVSAVEDTYSRLSSVKGSSNRADPLTRNGGNIKDAEVLDCRPTKVRRKMFDLELPADEYIDTEEAEQFRDDTASGTSSYLLNGNGKIRPAGGGKPFHAGKTDCLEDASKSNSCLRGKNSLADLNEPAQIEETDGSAFSHFLGHELSAKLKQELPCFPKDISVNSLRESEKKSVSNVHVEKNGTVRRFFCDVLEAGHSASNSKLISKGFQQQKSPVSSQQVQVPYEKTPDPRTFWAIDQSKADLSKEIILRGLEVPKRNGEIFNNSHPESIVMSNVRNLNPFASSEVIKPWSHSVTYWDKPCSSLSEKSMTVPTHPFLNSPGPSSKSSVMSSPSIGIFGEKWQMSSNSRLNPSFGSEFSNRNGFYYGSSSVSKESAVRFPSVSYDSKGVSEHFPSHGSTKPYGCSTSGDMKSTSVVNLNVVLSNRASDEPVLQCGTRIDGGRNREDHLRGLPWLQTMPFCKNDATSAGNDFNQNVTQDVKSVSFSNNVDTSRSEHLHNEKILGIPIFEKPFVSKNESSLTAPHTSVPRFAEVEAENKGRNRLLDINLPCDATLLDMNQDIVAENSAIEKETNTKVSSFRLQLDLNSCVDEDEASFTPSVPSTGTKTTPGIDLEAPLISDPEDVIRGEELLEKASEPSLQSKQSKDHFVQDELAKIAAEAIVAISSSCRDSNSDDVDCNSSENTMTDPLNWFVETISSFGEDLERKFEALTSGKDRDRDESSLEEIDYFESMVLNLAETREEDYMPEPLVPENFRVEETGATSLLTTRARRGQRRRGRQQRDFQRDILPGLVSLSRYEVTEDLQTFGGLMRATGYSWNSTRAGCGRGRRRSVTSSSTLVAATTCMSLTQELNNIEVGLEDRSLTGWGKTTRRPRRQRCPTGNPPSIALT
ncbi:protein O-linked-mannose beta-1,4-N-acetylglucosaminyltransferase 2-like [Hibiscus syriacus]|uniref:Protein O-linked-mannose beta-1,4-N-acetylglucosaminyltransferase 2-like n=1 Tax=Hibiscus syriacus TaxID=106335 RepID=A0A6A2WFL8_HIBSY|nr:uncharacterized protein LOC120193401 [Hibiscus syriacus]KAE8657413.1 protein O-linked-mannose beta-1,4-N-acetylglucosaminyltransferase 2-like [Hibiscus syriacus]